jgi:predicted AAA+ superfamily ATPase
MSEYYRKKYVDELLLLKDKKYIKVLTGIRRSGKSTILKQFKNKISDDFQIEESRIFEYNFNKPKFEKYTYMQLYNEIIEKADKDEINYVFLDEIQEIKE